jgi:hypothetical protein
VQEGVDRDPRQEEFVGEVQDWTGGLFRGGFRDAEDLRGTMTRTIHRLELSTATAAVDTSEMLARAQSLIDSRTLLLALWTQYASRVRLHSVPERAARQTHRSKAIQADATWQAMIDAIRKDR